MDIMTMAMVEDLKTKMDGIERKLQEITDMLEHNGEMLEEFMDKLECNGEMLEEILEEIRR